MFCWSLFVLLYFFFLPLCCLFFFSIRILILVSSNSSYSWNIRCHFTKCADSIGPLTLNPLCLLTFLVATLSKCDRNSLECTFCKKSIGHVWYSFLTFETDQFLFLAMWDFLILQDKKIMCVLPENSCCTVYVNCPLQFFMLFLFKIKHIITK